LEVGSGWTIPVVKEGQVGSGRRIAVVKEAQVGSGRSIPVVKVAQEGSGRTIPVVKEALVEVTLGQRALKIWVFVADKTDDLIVALDIMRAYHATVDVVRQVGRARVFEEFLTVFNCSVLSFWNENKLPS
jgi:hypothetical protein